MFCGNCGNQLKKNSAFCPNCGFKLGQSANIETPKTSELPNMARFYNENWQRVKFASSGGYYDILVDKDYFYLIWLPSYSSATFGTIVGLVILQLLGAILGYYIGKSEDDKKRKQYRSKWVDANYNLVSQDYEKNIVFKIPLAELQTSLVFYRNSFFKKDRFTINYNGKKYTLRKNKIACRLFFNYLESNVLL